MYGLKSMLLGVIQKPKDFASARITARTEVLFLTGTKLGIFIEAHDVPS